MQNKQKTEILGLSVMILLMSILPNNISAQEKTYVIRTMIEPHYEPPPAGHLNAFAPKCIFGTAPGMAWISGFVVEPLAKYWMLNGTYHPWLAQRWEATSDGLLVHLRRGVTWSDGTPFTAKDVVSTFYCLYLTRNIIWQNIDGVEAVDDYTVLFKTAYPKDPVTVYYALTSAILPYKIYGEFSDAAIIAHKTNNETMRNEILAKLLDYRPSELIGTGAYKIEDITYSDIILRKREDYWGLKLGFTKGIYFDKVSLFNSPGDQQVAQLELVDGIDFDYCGGSIIGQISAAPKRINCTFVAYPSTSSSATFFNLNRYPFTLKEFRQAIAYAINLTKAILSVYPVVVPTPENKHTSFIPSTMKTYLTDETWRSLKSYNYDTKKAEEILTSLGFKRGSDGIWVSPNGTRCEFEMVIHSGWGTGKVNTYIAQHLTEFGIKVNVIAVDPASVGDYLKNGDFDMCSQYSGGMLPYFEVANWAYNFLPNVIGGPGPGFPMVYEWKGELVNVTQLLFTMNKVDENTRKEIINTLAQLFNEYLPYLPHFVRPAGPFFINFEHVDWPLPYKKGEYKFPTPLIQGDDCEEWTYPFDRSPVWVIIKGLAKPKGLIIEKPAVELVVVFATENIPEFEGIDGKKYGPYNKGVSMVIPKEDAERLISEGKASYTSPLPSEITTILTEITSMKTYMSDVKSSISDVKSSVSVLNDQMSALSSQISIMITTVIIEALVIIILAIGLIIMVKRHGGH